MSAKLESQKRRGEHAARILKDSLVQEVLVGMRETVFHNIKTSHFKQSEEREELYRMLKAIEAFEREFKDRINTGKKAESKLKELLNKLR